uniref:Uncharacterized protein n=1 Tax=Entomoneis paludosa TaxID=265537 RepID=A0A7S2YTQ1_9STRA|mmetsp:Transcript_946/g.2185  ORF Transcript_946/g.2185 Transcript_946/m.2185 type:complete len:167 (+) Transcript_946:368-868(+)
MALPTVARTRSTFSTATMIMILLISLPVVCHGFSMGSTPRARLPILSQSQNGDQDSDGELDILASATDTDPTTTTTTTTTVANDDDELSWQEFLDRPFFVPEQIDDASPLKWFANLVENDYVTAEALFASFFITVMVIGTQEVLRMQLYGHDYIPFAKGASGGGLF